MHTLQGLQAQWQQEQNQYDNSLPGVHLHAMSLDRDSFENENQTASPPIALQSAHVQAVLQSSLSSELKPIKKMLSQTHNDLDTAGSLIKNQTPLIDQYNTKGTAITQLNAQLATQSKSSVIARIQKRLTPTKPLKPNS